MSILLAHPVGSNAMQDISWSSKIVFFGNTQGVANFLSIKTLKGRHSVTYDSNVEGGVFKVHTPGGIVKFKAHENWLHYLDMNDEEELAITLVTTIRDNFQGFSKKEIEGAIQAHKMQAMLGHPPCLNFENMVCARFTDNCPMSKNDIRNVYAIFGNNLTGLRDKTV